MLPHLIAAGDVFGAGNANVFASSYMTQRDDRKCRFCNKSSSKEQPAFTLDLALKADGRESLLESLISDYVHGEQLDATTECNNPVCGGAGGIVRRLRLLTVGDVLIVRGPRRQGRRGRREAAAELREGPAEAGEQEHRGRPVFLWPPLADLPSRALAPRRTLQRCGLGITFLAAVPAALHHRLLLCSEGAPLG